MKVGSQVEIMIKSRHSFTDHFTSPRYSSHPGVCPHINFSTMSFDTYIMHAGPP